MKTLIIILLMFLVIGAHGQKSIFYSGSRVGIGNEGHGTELHICGDPIWLSTVTPSTKLVISRDTITVNKSFGYNPTAILHVSASDTTDINKICKERGHITSVACMITLMHCPPYVIDTDSTSILVSPNCNTTTYKCSRCGKYVAERGKETRVVLWRKEKPKTTGLYGDGISRDLGLSGIKGTELKISKIK